MSGKGNIKLELPEKTTASLYAKTSRGKITSDHPVTLEQPVGPVIHAHGEVHDDLVLGLTKDRVDVLGKVDDLGGLVEVSLDDFEKLLASRHDDRSIIHISCRPTACRRRRWD